MAAAATAVAGQDKGFADTVRPDPVVPVLEDEYLRANGSVAATWAEPTDPAPSSGIARLEAELCRADDGTTSSLLLAQVSPEDRHTSLSLAMGVKGGTFVLGLRAIDEAGNVGPTSFTAPFNLNARPLAPVLHPRPRYTASEAIKPPVDASVDPDGDPIYAYYFRFTRLAPTPGAPYVSGELGPERHAPGELWQVEGYGTDSAGGAGWYSASHTFTVVDSPPTDAPVLQGVNPAYQAVRVPQASFQSWGETAATATNIEMSTDAAFTDLQAETWYSHSNAKFDFTDLPDGHYTISHRLNAQYGTSEALTTRVDLDRVAPEPPEPMIDADSGALGSALVLWREPVDPEPGSGVDRMDATLFRADRDTTRPLSSNGNLAAQGRTFVEIPPGEIGGTFRASLKATDRAGNVSEPTLSETFTLNGRPSAPVITLPSRVPTGEYVMPVVSGAVDPEGGPISYRYMFTLLPPIFPYTIPREYLTPDESNTPGREWLFQVTATDSEGASTTSSIGFTMVAGLPSTPVVRIQPAAPRPGDALRATLLREAVDPDDDTVKYHYTWYKATRPDSAGDEVTAFKDLAEVPAGTTREGEIWRLESRAYQETPTPTGGTYEALGGLGWDIVAVSSTNTPPELEVGLPQVITPGPFARIRAVWTLSDAQGDPTTVEIYLQELGQYQLGSPRLVVDGALGSAEVTLFLAPGLPYYLHLIARDSHGAITQRTSYVIPGTGLPPTGWELK